MRGLLQCEVLTPEIRSDGATPRFGPYPARAFWNEAERYLIEHTQGSVLAILDTCFAGSMHKGTTEDARTYEVIAAAAPDAPTAGPGPKSFTTALITSLKALHTRYEGRPFTTYELCNEISLQRERRRTPPHRFPRIKRYDEKIELAPLKRLDSERIEHFRNQQERAFLTLRFALEEESMSQDQVEDLAQHVSTAAKKANVSVRSIQWLGLRSVARSKLSSTVKFIRTAVALSGSIKRNQTTPPVLSARGSMGLPAPGRPTPESDTPPARSWKRSSDHGLERSDYASSRTKIPRVSHSISHDR